MFRVYNDQSNNFTDSIFIGEVFQIEVSDVVDLVHPLEIMKKSPSMEAARVFMGECFFGISYAFKVSNNQSNTCTHSICIGEVFQVEVSDDLIHPFEIVFGKVFTGA